MSMETTLELLDLEFKQTETRSSILKNLHEVLTAIKSNSTQNLENIIQNLDEKIRLDKEDIANKCESIRKCHSIKERYNYTIKPPGIIQKPDNFVPSHQRTSPREIISACGTFNAEDNKGNFKHIWTKFVAYGQNNYFDEEEYKVGLSYILTGEAYNTLYQLQESKTSLQEIIHFLDKLYIKKRSLSSDKKEIDNFKRLANEDISKTMTKADLCLQKIKFLYSTEAWPEIRNLHLRNILNQVIDKKTLTFIEKEENDTIQNTGLFITFEKILLMVEKFERNNNLTPTIDVSTIFQVGSGKLNINNIPHTQNEKATTTTDKSITANSSQYRSSERHTEGKQSTPFNTRVPFKNYYSSPERLLPHYHHRHRSLSPQAFKHHQSRRTSPDRTYSHPARNHHSTDYQNHYHHSRQTSRKNSDFSPSSYSNDKQELLTSVEYNAPKNLTVILGDYEVTFSSKNLGN